MAHFIRGNIPTTPEDIARWLSTNQQTQSMHGLALTVSEGPFSTTKDKFWTIIGQVKDQNSANVNGYHVVRFWCHQKDHSAFGSADPPLPSQAWAGANIHANKVYFGSLGGTPPATRAVGAVVPTDNTGKAWIQLYINSGNMQDMGGGNAVQSMACYGHLQGGWGDVKQATFVASNA